ncbi:MAG: hypothetical protein U0871_09800 [Gemmataceae bacterium]
MLTWDTFTEQKGQHTRSEADAATATPEVMAALWTRVIEQWDATPADRRPPALVAEFVTHSGRVEVSPCSDRPEPAERPFTVRLAVAEWDEFIHDRMPDPDDEDEWERAYDAHFAGLVAALKAGITAPANKKRFAAIKKADPRFAVFVADEGETPAHDRREFLWGNKPARRDFASDEELFVHLFHKAQIDPEDCMAVRDGRVWGAEWFGHEYDDRYVVLLEGVPDVATLCGGLKHLLLTCTKVTPTGVERLRALLPHTTVRVVDDEEWEAREGGWLDDLE